MGLKVGWELRTSEVTLIYNFLKKIFSSEKDFYCCLIETCNLRFSLELFFVAIEEFIEAWCKCI